jgi:hypothetical protein
MRVIRSPQRYRTLAGSRLRPLFCLLLLCGFGPYLFAEEGKTLVPTISFTLDFPGSDPAHYEITLTSDGHATYDSNGKLNSQAEAGDPTRDDFTVSQATSARFFDMAKRARYFEGELGSKKRNISSGGTKTVTFRDAQRSTQATYTYSPVPAIQEITRAFQNLSNTFEFGRRMRYEYRYQKLALAEELKNLDAESTDGFIEGIEAISSILRQIVNDPSVVTTARVRAQKLLATAK